MLTWPRFIKEGFRVSDSQIEQPKLTFDMAKLRQCGSSAYITALAQIDRLISRAVSRPLFRDEEPPDAFSWLKEGF